MVTEVQNIIHCANELSCDDNFDFVAKISSSYGKTFYGDIHS